MFSHLRSCIGRKLQGIGQAIIGNGDLKPPPITMLAGTEYSRYAIPLDYPPSREFSPRYGYSHRTIPELAEWFASYADDYAKFLVFMSAAASRHIPITPPPESTLPSWLGGPITAFDCLALYAMVLKNKPRTYLEIGSGMTTRFARQAIADARLDTRVISIDPQPRSDIDEICDEIVRDGLETCDLSIFDELASNDIVFLDGSHRAFMNSDVTVFFIDVLPRLRPGVLVHIHDILLPWDYPPSFKHWYWNEQYMLAVYMMSNKERLYPALPTAWVTKLPEFGEHFTPIIDLGGADVNESWRSGGSMWFTKTA